MNKRDVTSAIVDNILKIGVTSSVLAAGLLLPNLLIALDRPLELYLRKLDKRSREREMRRIVSYMKTQRMIKGDYAHGLIITKKGEKRLNESEFNNLKIKQPVSWDHKWRIVFFDIPEQFKSGRDALTNKLKALGFYQLQRSVWIHPFPCRDVIERVTDKYRIARYVSYIETTHLDNQHKLIEKFRKSLRL